MNTSTNSGCTILSEQFGIRLAGGPGLAERLSRFCRVRPVGVEMREEAPRQHCLLVESDWLSEVGESGATPVLEEAEAASMPTLLWIKGKPPGDLVLALAPRFDRAFAADAADVGALYSAGASDPSPLLEAATLTVPPGPPSDTSERPFGVVWIGSWNVDWPEEWRRKVSSVLRGAARYDLHAPQRDSLPAELGRSIAPTPAGMSNEEVLRHAKVAIVTSADSPSRSAVPEVLFDAMACGAAVVSPHRRGATIAGFWSAVPGKGVDLDMVTRVGDETAAARGIEGLLASAGGREQIVGRCRRFVLQNHTYAHRVATIASAVGHQMIPDATPRPALH